MSGTIWAVSLVLGGAFEVAAATLPAGFAETRLASGLNNVTAMTLAPDGRVFVSEQGTGAPGQGRIKIVKQNGTVVTALTLTVDATNERGVLGTALDPAFPATPHIYLYYTIPNPSPDPAFPNKGAHNRVSRFTVTGDTIDPASEVPILNLPDLGTAPIHNAGSLHFAPDGTLFISVGENFNAPNSQNTAVPLGKLLRINKDGSIPADNPFVGNPAYHPAIWALGLRNPFTFDIQPGTGRILENEVGDKLYDEINDIVKGGNYGWADTEGPHNDPRYLQPFVPLPWSSANCTVIGAAFYNPTNPTFPQQYLGKFFHSDLCAGFINVLDPATGQITEFVPRGGLKTPVDLDVANNGDLYYLNRGAGPGTGEVWKIFVSNGGAHVSAGPQSQKVTIGENATFTCSATGFKPLTYTWTVNGGTAKQETDPPSGTSTLTFPVTAGDNGATVTCSVSNSLGSDQAGATLTTTNDTTPNAVILTPADGTTYHGGDVLSFSGDAFDQEDGQLPASAFTWTVLFDHEFHSHPGITLNGVKSGSYTIPAVGETSPNVKYRIILKVTDSAGLTRVVERNVLPVVSNMTIASSPSGREIKLDGQPKTAPVSFDAVSGMTRTLDVQQWQHLGEGAPTSTASTTWFQFQGWSDGGAPAHTITVPDQSSTITANFNTLVSPECITFPTLSRFLNTPFPNQNDQFNLEFDATAVATTSSKINVTIGFSDGPRGGLPGQAGAIIFAAPAAPTPGVIQGRGFTGGEPATALAPTYVTNQQYHFRLNIDLGTHTYDAYYTAPNQAEAVLKTGLRFRAEHLFITQLNNWGVFASPIAGDPSATVQVCRMSVNCTGPKNTPPVLVPPAPVVVHTGAGATSCSKVVTDGELGTATAGDNCKFRMSAISRSGVPAGNVFPVGTTTITYSVTDGGGLTTTATQTVTVIDDTPPTISGASATPNVFWPPNHTMHDVTVNYTVSDNCSATSSLIVTANEGTSADWEVLDAHHVRVRSERSGESDRVYTITIAAVDASGNASSENVTVTVPHDQGQ
jgi:glucose/arabinose dehydrogenase